MHSHASVTGPESIRIPIDPMSGQYRSLLWRHATLNNRPLQVGIEYIAPPDPMPNDGGTCPAGTWKDGHPSGRVVLHAD